MAQALGVNPWAFRRWLDGAEPVPLMAYKFAACIAGQCLPVGFGKFSGMRREGEWLLVADRAAGLDGIRFEDLASMGYLRQCAQEVEGLAAQVRRLTKERDFYKGQCFRDSRYGMVVNDLFDY